MARGFVLHCATCPAVTHEINTDNVIVAQRVAKTYFHWQVYKDANGEWKRACPACVRAFSKKGKT